MPDVRLTAEIVHGAKTNRVRVKSGAKPERRPRKRSEAWRPRSKGLFKRDRTTEGAGVVRICVSMTRENLALITAAARRAQMSRSRFLSQASKLLLARIEGL